MTDNTDNWGSSQAVLEQPDQEERTWKSKDDKRKRRADKMLQEPKKTT